MHELHLIKDLLDDALKIGKVQNAKKITKIYIKMGEFSEISPEIFRQNFAELNKGTIANGAEIEIKHSKARELRLVSFDCE